MIAFIMAIREGNDARRRQPIRENLLSNKAAMSQRSVARTDSKRGGRGGVLSAAQVCLPKGSSDNDQSIPHEQISVS
jgi:hypothetical protein